jgi:hypothetical protein
MTEVNTEDKSLGRPARVSAYQQLSGLLTALKSEEISINDAMNKIQLKDTKPARPYCKVTQNGALALHGVTKQPIVLYADQWNKLMKVTRSDYLDNYIKYNESRLKYRTNRKQNSKESNDSESEFA